MTTVDAAAAERTGSSTEAPPRPWSFMVRPRWLLFHAAMLVAVLGMTLLGFWQLRRLDERQAFNRDVAARTEQPAIPVTQLLPASTPRPDVEWRAVTARGRFLPDEEILLVNRSIDGQPGSVVVTPLELDNGRLLLVQRGFVALGESVGGPPVGPVELVGRLRNPPPRRLGGLTDAATGELRELQRLDIDRLAPQLPGEVLPMFVELTAITPGLASGAPALLPLPVLNEGSHLSYAVQWFLFAGAACAGWVLAVRHSRAAGATV